jgi:phytoene desaturase
MLNGTYVSKEVDHAYRHWELFIPIVQVSFGISKPVPSDTPILLNFVKGMSIGSTPLEYGFSLMNYSYDDTMAPAGMTTVVMRYESRWKYWENLDGAAYQEEKERIMLDATACLEAIYPGITGSIDVVDVATPRTNVKYTGVRDGAYEGFMPSKENMMKSLKMQLPGLRNFYMAGQWLFPGGGLPPSAQSGKWAVQLICKNRKQVFIVP